MKDELADQNDTLDCMSDDIALLSEEIEQWKDIAGEMREHYEEAIHSLTPETFGKHWVKNIGKKVRFLSEIVLICIFISHVLTFFDRNKSRWNHAVDYECR